MHPVDHNDNADNAMDPGMHPVKPAIEKLALYILHATYTYEPTGS
jgi:hypothetical protein